MHAVWARVTGSTRASDRLTDANPFFPAHLSLADFKFSMYPPSMVAAASIATAIQGLRRNGSQWQFQQLQRKLSQITGIEVVSRLQPSASLLSLSSSSLQLPPLFPSCAAAFESAIASRAGKSSFHRMQRGSVSGSVASEKMQLGAFNWRISRN